MLIYVCFVKYNSKNEEERECFLRESIGSVLVNFPIFL